MTHQRRDAPARETHSIERERPQRSRGRLQRRMAAAALAAAVLVAGAASAVILGAGSAAPAVNPGTTSTRPITTTSANATAVPNPPAQTPQTALAAVSTYWAAIGRHDFAAAYAVLAPGAVPQTEPEWAFAEQSTGVESVRFRGEAGDASGNDATIMVLSLVTVDVRFGCRSWTGSYEVSSHAGRWLIARADITPRPCTTG